MIDVYSIEAFAFYLYNQGPLNVVWDVFGLDIHPSYAKEKCDLLMRGFHVLWGRLDSDHKRRFALAAQRFADQRGFDPTKGLQ